MGRDVCVLPAAPPPPAAAAADGLDPNSISQGVIRIELNRESSPRRPPPCSIRRCLARPRHSSTSRRTRSAPNAPVPTPTERKHVDTGRPLHQSGGGRWPRTAAVRFWPSPSPCCGSGSAGNRGGSAGGCEDIDSGFRGGGGVVVAPALPRSVTVGGVRMTKAPCGSEMAS